MYLGAMIVLITVGGYLAGLSVWFTYAGFAVEALFLLLLSVIWYVLIARGLFRRR